MLTLSQAGYMVLLFCLFIITAIGWLCIVVGVSNFLNTFKIAHRQRKKALRISCMLFIVLGLILASPFWFCESVDEKDVIISKQDSIIAIFPRNSLLWQWKWNSIIKNARLTTYITRQALIDMTTHPITENPKVRSFQYLIEIKTKETPEDLLRMEHELGTHSRVSWVKGDSRAYDQMLLHNRARSILFEFNESHSKDVAKLYNPLDDMQQERFRRMITEYFHDPLEKMGAEIVAARFDIGN